MTDTHGDLPIDYKWIDWEHLYQYVGRAVIGDHVPYMTEKVAKYLDDQARQMHQAAQKLTMAAQIVRANGIGKTTHQSTPT